MTREPGVLDTALSDPLAAVLGALGRGRVVDLGHRLVVDMPIAPTHPPYQFALARRHGDRPRDDGISTANEILVLAAHTGTHVDAVGHASRDGKLAGGVDAAWAQSGGSGLRVHGAEALAPILSRGLLLDVAGLHGLPCLAPAYEVTVEDLVRAEERAGVTVQAGDAVLIRTGWGGKWSSAGDFVGSAAGTPGPGFAAAEWLLERQISITGSDTLVYEVVRPDANVRPVHGRLLVDSAVPIMEALDLEGLAHESRADFLFVMSPLKLVGATGSPVRPLAVCFDSESTGGGPS